MSCPVVLGPDGVLTPAQWRVLIPAFKNSSKYPDETIAMYCALAATMLNPQRWQNWLPYGEAYLVAHWVTLDAIAAKAAERGGIPGQTGGILSSKSIGGVSAGYDVTTGSEAGAGYYNQTSYGQRYWHMVRLVGMGATQITGIGVVDSQQTIGGLQPYLNNGLT